MVWAMHWLMGFLRMYFDSCTEDGEHCYRSQSFYRFLWLSSDRCWPIESIAKATFPFLTM